VSAGRLSRQLSDLPGETLAGDHHLPIQSLLPVIVHLSGCFGMAWEQNGAEDLLGLPIPDAGLDHCWRGSGWEINSHSGYGASGATKCPSSGRS
jgi:hypothetical protein